MDNRKKVFTQYVEDSHFYVTSKNADKFEFVMENILLLLKLKHNLTSDFAAHGFFNITLYARNKIGMADFCFRLDGSNSDGYMRIQIISLINIEFLTSALFDYQMGTFSFEKVCDEECVLNILESIMKFI